jgi:hypothetical protein
VLAVVGAGPASCLPRRRADVAGATFEALAIGLVVEVIVGATLLRTGHYSRSAVLAVSLVVIAVSVALRIWLGVRRKRSTATDDDDDDSRPRRRVPSEALALAALALIVLVAIVLRRGPSYFIFMLGDMGEYVNNANILAASGRLTGSFPHGFTVFLGGTNLLLGQAHTVAGLPALGIMLLLGAYSYVRAVRLHVLAALGVAALIAVHPSTVWFSRFPVSESLYAVLLIAALFFVVRARTEVSHAYAASAGIVVGLMLLVRVNAMLLAPILVVVLLGSAVVDDKPVRLVQRTFTLVALFGLSCSYAYDLRFSTVYTVDKQLKATLPHLLFRIGNRARLFEISVPLVIALLAGAAATVAAELLVVRYLRPRVGDRTVGFWQILYGTLVAGTVLALAVMHHGGLIDALARWGPVTVVLMVVGLAAVIAKPGRFVDGVDGWLLLLIVCTYSMLFAGRVKVPMSASFYLYWDRYLFSEVMPAAIILVAIGLHLGVHTFVAATRARVATRVAIAGAAVVAAIAFLPTLRETHRITRFSLFGNAYQTIDRLDTLTGGDRNVPVVYSGLPSPPPGWLFQNTYRAFELPLGLSFDRHVVGMPSDPFGKDVVVDADAARAKLRKAGLDHGYLIALRTPGTDRPPDDARTHYVGTVEYVSPLLGRTKARTPAQWRLVPFQFDVYSVST